MAPKTRVKRKAQAAAQASANTRKKQCVIPFSYMHAHTVVNFFFLDGRALRYQHSLVIEIATSYKESHTIVLQHYCRVCANN